jgi:hypothetical protein
MDFVQITKPQLVAGLEYRQQWHVPALLDSPKPTRGVAYAHAAVTGDA